MKRLLLVVLPVLLSAATAAAQPTYRLGLRGGLNRASTTLAAASNSPDSYPIGYSGTKSAIYAWQAGAALEIAFRHFALQPALLFSQKGDLFTTITSGSGGFGVTNTQESRVTSRSNWLELPVNVVYSWRGFQAFAGPYLAMAVGGQQRGQVSGTSPSVRYGSYEYTYSGQLNYGSDTQNRRFDAGLNVGVGYRRGPLQAQLGYGIGLLNLHQPISGYVISENPYYHDFNADAAYSRVVQLTGTYFFEL